MKSLIITVAGMSSRFNKDTKEDLDVGRTGEILVQGFNPVPDSAANIHLTSYAPDVLEYTSSSSLAKTAVFSEIYYPYGWKAYIDGQPTEIFRANYILRALNIPAGEHQIRFEFRPDTVYKGNKVSIACLILMLAFVAGSIGWGIRNYMKAE